MVCIIRKRMSGNSKELRRMFEGISSFQNIGTLNAYLQRKRGRKHQVKVEAPGRKILDMVNAYKDTQVHMKEFELEMSRL